MIIYNTLKIVNDSRGSIVGEFRVNKTSKSPNFLSKHPCSAHVRHQLIVVPKCLYDLSLSLGIVRIHRYDQLAPGRLFSRYGPQGRHRDRPATLRDIRVVIAIALRVPAGAARKAESRAEKRAHIAYGDANEAVQMRGKRVWLAGGVATGNRRFLLRGEDVAFPALDAPKAEQRCEEDEPTWEKM